LKSRNITHHPNYDGAQFSTVEDEIEDLKAAVDAVLPAPGMVDAGVFYDASEAGYSLFTPTAPLSFSGTTLAISAASTSAVGVIKQATASEVRSAATGNLAITPSLIESASAPPSALSESAGAIAVDWDAFIYDEVTIDQDTVVSNPTNGQPGTHRQIYIIGNNTTDRTITFGNQFLGEIPTITDCDSGRAYLITIFCRSTTHFVVSAKRALG
jgi:hypothetical protein